MSRIVVGLSNLMTRLRRTRVRPDELLLLFPICLQCSECPNNIVNDVTNCKRCGKCKVSDLVALSEKYGCRIEAATGGRLAVVKVRTTGVRAVVAVACHKELRQGILASFPKAVIGVVNAWPKGPCKDTDVDLGAVERAIQWFLRT
ncbi:MAG TPA: DUF116 domain-containing protein [Planctomycetota bacterium]|nr:DUF116 domain-containing protein [Planctomycetota bacterium]